MPSDDAPRGPKPPIESPGERRIREAIEAGEFDRLAGKGKPIAGLDEPYDELWWVKQKVRDERLSAVPEAIAIRRDVEAALERLGRIASERAVREVVAALNDRIRKVNATTTAGPGTSLAPIRAEQVVARWRAARSPG